MVKERKISLNEFLSVVLRHATEQTSGEAAGAQTAAAFDRFLEVKTKIYVCVCTWSCLCLYFL